MKTTILADLGPTSEYKMEVKDFDSYDDLLKYYGHSKYEYDRDDRPGLCFSISLTTSETGKYTANFHFDDQEYEKQNLPDQKLDVVSKIIRAPDLNSYNLYKRGGFLYA